MFKEGKRTYGNEKVCMLEAEKAYCDKLESIYLPESLTEISNIPFNQQHSITIFVKKDSYADKEFDSFSDGLMTKEYY